MSIRLLFNDIKFKEHLELFIPSLFEEAKSINTNSSVRKGRLVNVQNMFVGKDREEIIKVIFLDWIKENYSAGSMVSKISSCCIEIAENLNYDSIFFEKKVQIKTRTTIKNETGNFKLNWASGLDNAELFKSNFKIDTDILYVRISKNKNETFEKVIFSYIDQEVQNEILRLKGIEGYFDIKEKDSKGIKINTKSLKKMINHQKTLNVTILYKLKNTNINYKNRIEYWNHRLNEYKEKVIQNPVY